MQMQKQEIYSVFIEGLLTVDTPLFWNLCQLIDLYVWSFTAIQLYYLYI